MALELRPVCERCSAVLAPDGEARICSFECTFCAPCADQLGGVCPNCGGELVARPEADHGMSRRLDGGSHAGVGSTEPAISEGAGLAGAGAGAGAEVPALPVPERGTSGSARHLYVHLPFCAHRCGYCDFVTVVGRGEQHGGYVDALLQELELERGVLAPELETIFLGGGTPTFTALPELVRLLESLPPAADVTVEANPETVTPELARALRAASVTRVSLGAQTFQPELLRVLERVAGPDDVRRAVHHLRDAQFDNISLDLIYGIPGQSSADLAADLGAALALEPEHLSCYELEAKPGTRFTHAWGEELKRQADAMEDYFERVVATLTGAGYRWYETANFCRVDSARDLRSQHNLAYWLGRDYLGIGIGAVSTIDTRRWRNAPRLGRYLEALAAGCVPERELEDVGGDIKARERVMLGLRLDEPLPLDGLRHALDPAGLARVEGLGLAERSAETLALTERGRYLGGAVTAELLA